MIAVLIGINLLQQRAYGVAPADIFQTGERILFQGDSITDGGRGRSDDPNHILGHGYAFIIAALYGANFADRGLTFINRGNSGDTVESLASRWQSDTLNNHPDVLSVLVGVNDVLLSFRDHKEVPIAQYESTYDRILADARRSNPKLKLILCEPFFETGRNTANDLGAWKTTMQKMRSVVERLGEKYHAPVVHLQQVFDEACKRAPTDHWIWDGIHPTYSGHQLLAEAWVRAYNDYYVPPEKDPVRNTAIAPEVNRERESYYWLHRHGDVRAEH